MSFSYSGLTNYGKASLPSAEGWGSNMNILRDPPKSIHTRRIDKVGQTSNITAMIDDSGNRVCEGINVFARGVNPMVSVSYDNVGNNGGQGSGVVYGNSNIPGADNMLSGGRTQAYLPYRVMRDGAFRPPVVTQADLLPLSRLPRIWTTAFTKPGFVDFSKKMRSCGTAENTKEVKTNILHTSIRPTAVYKIETPLKEPFEVKYMIQPSLKKSYTAPISSTDRTSQFVTNPTKNINRDNIHSFAQSNKQDIRHINNNDFNPDRYLQDTNAHDVYTNINDNSKYVNNNEFDPVRYIQDANAHEVNTNLGSHIQLTSIEDIFDMAGIKTKDAINVDYVTPISGVEKVEYIHDDIELERSIPNYSTSTNIRNNEQKIINHEYMIDLERNTPLTNMSINPSRIGDTNKSNRDYYLQEKPQFGGFEGRAQMPMVERQQQIPENYESDKSKMNRKVEEMFSRYKK